MARPVKNYCDYFSHDRDMRNHRKIKAIRNKFGISGYGIWCMLLEYLTGADGNILKDTDLDFELVSGDFGVSAAEIRQLVSYGVSIHLLHIENGVIYSKSLNERLSHVYEKRKAKQSKSESQPRNNGVFASHNTAQSVVSAPETPQSKVKESKVYNTIITNSKEFVENEPLDSSGVVGVVAATKKIKKKKIPQKKKDAEPYWYYIRKLWIMFNRTHLKFNVEPIPDRDYSHLHRIVEKIRERAKNENIEWEQAEALKRIENFFIAAYSDKWLRENFLLSNLESSMQKIFKLIESPVSIPGKTIIFD